MKTNSIAVLLADARHRLTGDTATLDARLLLQAAGGLSHAELISEPQRELMPAQLQTFNAFVARRAGHEPVSRILGTREFYGRNFKVTPAVLDPRPDTECVVDLALKSVKKGRFIDLGTGSGAIAITLCAENSALSGIASDISTEALAVAQENAQALGVADRLSFHKGPWLKGVGEKFDLIISNPPYIREDASLPPDVKNFDPHLALFGGPDGLEAYCAIATQSRDHLLEKGHVVVEVGYDQADAVVEIFRHNGFDNPSKAIDIAGYIRGLAFQLKP